MTTACPRWRAHQTTLPSTTSDVSVFVNGLSGKTLAFCAQDICNLAIDQGVAVRFRHRDRVLRLAEERSDLPPTADLDAAP